MPWPGVGLFHGRSESETRSTELNFRYLYRYVEEKLLKSLEHGTAHNNQEE